MDYLTFKENHMIYSDIQDRYVVTGLSVVNIAYGPEAVQVALAMGAQNKKAINKIKFRRESPDDGRYSSHDFLSMHNYSNNFSITIGDEYRRDSKSTRMYQPEFKKHMIKAQAEYSSDFMPDEEADKDLINDMYAALGMEDINDV